MSEPPSRTPDDIAALVDIPATGNAADRVRKATIARFLEPLRRAPDGLGFSDAERSAILRYATIVGEEASKEEYERLNTSPLFQIDRVIEGLASEVESENDPDTPRRLQQFHLARATLRTKFIAAHQAAELVGLVGNVNSRADGVEERLGYVSSQLNTAIIEGERDVHFVERVVRALGVNFEGTLEDRMNSIEPHKLNEGRSYSLFGEPHSYYAGAPSDIQGVTVNPFYSPKANEYNSRLTGKSNEVGFSVLLGIDTGATRRVLTSPQLPKLPKQG